MVKRKITIYLLIICLCLSLAPFTASAISTSDAAEPISTQRECTLTISYRCNNTVFPDILVKLYKVAEISSDCQYTLASAFEDTNLTINGIQAMSDWRAIRQTLDAHILTGNIEADFTAMTDKNGNVRFEGLEPGLYLTVGEYVTVGDMIYAFDSSLFAIPGLGTDGLWQYDLSAVAKAEAIPPIGSDEIIELKVVKLWKDENKKESRPEAVSVDIYRNAQIYKTITLSEENNWTYNWSTKDANAVWKVVEKDVPEGYTMTVEEREASFVLTNTLIDDNDPPGGSAPQTGETTNIMFYVIVFIAAGIFLVIIGLTGKKKRV